MHADDRQDCHVFVTLRHVVDAIGLDSSYPTHRRSCSIESGVDAAGFADLEAMDRHWDQLLLGVALSTLIGVTAELVAPDCDNQTRVIVATRESAQVSTSSAFGLPRLVSAVADPSRFISQARPNMYAELRSQRFERCGVRNA
jgi:hypothetical protein